MAGEERKGARQLRSWINGSVPPWHGNVFDHMRPLLAQSAILSVNKQERTVGEIADQVAAGREYVEETAGDLLEMDVLICPRKGKYLANFIALDAEDWRRLAKLVKQPAAETATRLAAGEEALREAFGRTTLAASGWQWDEVAWTVYSVLVANFGARRHEPDSYHPPLPERPQGGQYLMGGYENNPDLPVVWLTGFNSYVSSHDFNIGSFWTYGLERSHPEAFRAGSAVEAFLVFAHGALTESEALARLGGDAERWRGVLAKLVHEGFIRRANGQLRAGVPLLTRSDADALAPAVDQIMRPVITELVVPALAQVPSVLDTMGYGHWYDQYGQWQTWLSSNAMGEALRFLMEQGILSRPSDPALPSFASVAWQGQRPF